MNRSHDKDVQQINYKLYLPEAFRTYIEQTFYKKIIEKAKLENLKGDQIFLKNPIDHIALFSDHGIVHVRDVAHQVLEVIHRANGKLLPERPHADLEFIRAYSLHLAYLHDIGMVDFSEFGRFMHPEFAAHYVFQSEFDALLDLLWNENAGNIPWQLLSLFKEKDQDRIPVIFREMLALSIAHSKSKLGIKIVNEPGALRQHMIYILTNPLEQLYLEQKVKKLEGKLKKAEDKGRRSKIEGQLEAFKAKLQLSDIPTTKPFPAQRFYDDFKRQAFDWLEDPDPAVRKFVINVLDSLRCLRSADALRQRGTVLRTSASYEVFVDQNTANAIFALRSANNEELYLLEGEKPINAGEANLASSEMDLDGNLRVAFHRGNFKSPQITKKAAYNAAVAINDIQNDTIQSFLRNASLDSNIFAPPKKAHEDIKILIEGVDDNPYFASLVLEALGGINPEIQGRLKTTVSLQGADLKEVKRYLGGVDVNTRFPNRYILEELVDKVAHSGLFVQEMEVEKAFEDVRVIKMQAQEMLLQGGSVSGFVYIPLSTGLRVFPLGGYESKPAPAWVPIGNTGVIRGSVRNANVFVEKDLELLIIPKETYLSHWYIPYTAKTLGEAWGK